MANELTPLPTVYEAIDRALAPVAEMAARAKGVAYQNRETLIELCGKSGKNGTIGQMAKDTADNETRSRKTKAEVAAMKSERRATFGVAGVGACSGGGLFYGLFELIKYLN